MNQNNLSPLFQHLKAIRNAADDIDIQEESGLPSDVIDTIENPEGDHSEITLSQLANYLFPLGYTLEFETVGMGKLSPQPPCLTIRLEPLSDPVVSLRPL